MKMVYNIDFDIAAIVILLFTIFYIFNKKGLIKNANRIYLIIVFASLISAIADISSSVANSITDTDNFLIQDILNYTFLGMHNLTPYLFVLYIIYLLGLSHNMHKRHFILVTLPIIADIVALFLNPFLRWIFYYDQNGAYLHGPMFILLYAVSMLYLTSAIVLVIKFRSLLNKERSNSLLFFMIISIIPVIVQAIYPYILLEIFFQSIGLLGLLFSIENKDEIINPSTNVYNRYAFVSAAEAAIRNGDTTVIIVKLSNIQYYNTTAGVEYMTWLQKEIAQWLDGIYKGVRCYDCNNGHFALIGHRMTEENITTIKNIILKRFNNTWSHISFQAAFPIQICQIQIPEDISTMENLLLIVDLPFDDVKSCELDASEAVATYQRRILIERLIHEALEKKNFQVWYQPIWDKTSGRIHSAEALIRLIDDELGFISPEEFIPIAEQNGTIIDIGTFVFDEVCSFYKKHRLEELGIDYIEVNLSVVQYMNSRLAEEFDSVLIRHSLDAERINLEITESAASGNRYALMETVNALEAQGFTFSLDDYGTGYSNISYMYDMPFTIIKLDKSILWSALHPKTGMRDENAMILLENTIHMMKEMHYKVLVEGVETSEQKTLLEKLGCDYFQGYYFSKPVPGDTFLEFVKMANAC